MNKYIISAPHKCGSTILKKITEDITNVNIKPDKGFIIQTDRDKGELHFSRGLRLNQKMAEEDQRIFIPRNPISICISAYYSFGYTHPKPSQLSDAQFIHWRNKIQKVSLERYIDNNIENKCIFIQNILDFDCKNKIILPYELMISNFADFLERYLTALNMASLYESTYSKWKSAFKPIEDQSDLIVAGVVKQHKRTTDIDDWKKKLSRPQLEDYIMKYPVINKYCDLLNSYNL